MAGTNKLSLLARRTLLRPSAATLVALLGVACGEGEDDAREHAALAEGVPCEPRIDGGTPHDVDGGGEEPGEDEALPGLPRFVTATANGTGCPAGTWKTEVAPDGETFTLRFEAYEAALADGTRTAIKDCNVAVRLRAPDGLSFALTDFSHHGHAKLDEGVRGFATVSAYFQGSPALSGGESRIDLNGPLDRPLVVHHRPEGDARLWSPCGLERNLNIVTRVGVQKNAEVAGTGAVAIDAIGNPEDAALSFRLAWRRCKDGAPVDAPDLDAPEAPEVGTPVVDSGVAEPPERGADAGKRAPSHPRRPRFPWGGR